jgi:hypothetical protein
MGDVQGHKKVNDTCMKTMHTGTTDRGFAVQFKIFWIPECNVLPPAWINSAGVTLTPGNSYLLILQ